MKQSGLMVWMHNKYNLTTMQASGGLATMLHVVLSMVRST